MQRGEIGSYEVTSIGGDRVRAFVPLPLPPTPALILDGSLQQALESAVLALGRLDAVSTLLPDNALFLYSYVRKEAVLSSQIEGTQSSLSDLLLFEIEETPGVPLDGCERSLQVRGGARTRSTPLAAELSPVESPDPRDPRRVVVERAGPDPNAR